MWKAPLYTLADAHSVRVNVHTLTNHAHIARTHRLLARTHRPLARTHTTHGEHAPTSTHTYVHQHAHTYTNTHTHTFSQCTPTVLYVCNAPFGSRIRTSTTKYFTATNYGRAGRHKYFVVACYVKLAGTAMKHLSPSSFLTHALQ